MRFGKYKIVEGKPLWVAMNLLAVAPVIAGLYALTYWQLFIK